MRSPKKAKKKAIKPAQSRTAKKKAAFLAAYIGCATITHAAEAAKVGRRTHYDWLKADPDYQEAFAEADKAASDTLVKEARRRAVEGVEELVFYQGEVVGAVQKYSDSLLMFLIKGDQPEKYRDRHEVVGDPERPVTGPAVALSKLFTLDQLREAKQKINGHDHSADSS